MKDLFKEILRTLGIDAKKLIEEIGKISILLALSEGGLIDLVKKLRKIQPDVSKQESKDIDGFNDYWELKIRGLHAFQCSLMLKGLKDFSNNNLTVVDIGDSAGTHMHYLKELTRGKLNLDTTSINLDPRAIEKIRSRGMNAILCRGEELNMADKPVDLFTSFEMLEHLHNPITCLRRLAKESLCRKLIITVPYLRSSRVGLHHMRKGITVPVYAEEEHIFELNPSDWTLLMLHSGWRTVYSKVYYQYPKKFPFISQLLKQYWRHFDFEGFWGAILEKDTTLSDCYCDWEL